MIDLICNLFGVTLEQSNQSYIYGCAILLVVLFIGLFFRCVFAVLNNIFK